MRRVFALLLAACVPAGCGRGDDVAGGSVEPVRPPWPAPDRRPVDAPGWSLHPPAAGATPMTADGKPPGEYPAGSRVKDRKANGGFGPCNNYPHSLADKAWGSPGEISLVAFPDEPVAYFKYRGLALRVINRTSAAVPFRACDSMLSIIRQAQDGDGQWRDVESPVQPICGNSYHRVFLGAGEYWQFPAREYAGPIKAKLRFVLKPGDGRPPVFSNEFDGQITAAQLAAGK